MSLSSEWKAYLKLFIWYTWVPNRDVLVPVQMAQVVFKTVNWLPLSLPQGQIVFDLRIKDHPGSKNGYAAAWQISYTGMLDSWKVIYTKNLLSCTGKKGNHGLWGFWFRLETRTTLSPHIWAYWTWWSRLQRMLNPSIQNSHISLAL